MKEISYLSDILGWSQVLFHTGNVFDIGKEITLSNEALIQKIQRGEKYLFENLVERYTQKIFRYLFYYFNFQQDIAEDVVQEIFVKLWEKLDKYDSKQKFEPWLYRFVHNFTIDRIRKYKKENAVRSFSQMGTKKDDDSCNNFVENFVVDDSDLKRDTDRNIKGQIIQTLVTQLEEKYRKVVILFYFEQKSYDEIAYILKTNVNNVGTMLSRAKQRMKVIISQNPGLADILHFDL